MRSRIILIVSILFIAGCASATGPIFERTQATENQALVYVYRKDLGYWQSAYPPTLLIDSKSIASIPREGYLAIHITPGEHTFGFEHNILAGYKPVKISLDVLANHSYFLKISDPLNVGGAPTQPNTVSGSYTSEIALINEQIALQELATTRLVTP